MVILFLQSATEGPDVSVLIQYGAAGVLAILAIGAAVYVTRKYEAQTSRFISHLESTAEKQQHAAIQQASAAHLMASAGERQSEASLSMAKQIEINNHIVVDLKRSVETNSNIIGDLKRSVEENTRAVQRGHQQ